DHAADVVGIITGEHAVEDDLGNRDLTAYLLAARLEVDRVGETLLRLGALLAGQTQPFGRRPRPLAFAGDLAFGGDALAGGRFAALGRPKTFGPLEVEVGHLHRLQHRGLARSPRLDRRKTAAERLSAEVDARRRGGVSVVAECR